MGMSNYRDILSDMQATGDALVKLGKEFRMAARNHEKPYGPISRKLEDVAGDLMRYGRELPSLEARVEQRIPDTASGWQLYSTKPGSARAAKALATQMKKDAEKIKRQLNSDMSVRAAAKKLNVIYKAGIGAKLEKYADFGARDTEPRGVAAQLYADIAKPALGYSVGDYMPDLVDGLGW